MDKGADLLTEGFTSIFGAAASFVVGPFAGILIKLASSVFFPKKKNATEAEQ